MSAVTILVIFALGCIHVTGANEQLSLTDFLLDFLLSLWVPLSYVPSQQVLNIPDPAKREQLISIEKSKIALNNYINHLLRYAEENGGLTNGQIADTKNFILDPSLVLPEPGQLDGEDSSQNNVPPPSGSSIYLTSGGYPNFVQPSPDYIPPNCKPTSYSCDNPVPNQSGHFHPAHDHPFEFHPSHYHQNKLHSAHFHQPFFHPSHFHNHHTIPVGIDGNDGPVAMNNPPPDNYPVAPAPDLPPADTYPLPPNDPSPTDFNYDNNCDPLDPMVIFNPNLCANLFLPYYSKLPYLQPGYVQPTFPDNQQITNPEPLYPSSYYPSQPSNSPTSINQQPSYYPSQSSNLLPSNQPPVNGQRMLWGGRKRSYPGDSRIIFQTFPRKRASSELYKEQLNSLAKRIIYLVNGKHKQQPSSRSADMYKSQISKSVSPRDLGSSDEKVNEEKKVEASDSNPAGSRIFEDWKSHQSA